MTVEALLDSIRQLHQDVLGQLLIGCYVHGSLALGCFQWNRSDIDFLTIVHAQPSPAQKEALIAGLLRLELSAPPKGLETSVLCQDALLCRGRFTPPRHESREIQVIQAVMA